MTTTETDLTNATPYEEGPDSVALFDAEDQEPTTETEDGTDFTLWEFVRAVSEFPKQKDLKVRILLAIAVLSKGKAGWTVDWDAVSSAVKRQKGSLTNYQRELMDEGWLSREPGVSADGRPVFTYKTARTIGG